MYTIVVPSDHFSSILQATDDEDSDFLPDLPPVETTQESIDMDSSVSSCPLGFYYLDFLRTC